MASAIWRSSAPMPGYAPVVSMSVMMGRPNLLGEPHQAQRLAITFGMRAAEIAQNVFLRVAALLRADDHDAVFAEPGKTADHRAVLGKKPVAVQFLKIGERLSAGNPACRDVWGAAPIARAARR